MSVVALVARRHRRRRNKSKLADLTLYFALYTFVKHHDELRDDIMEMRRTLRMAPRRSDDGVLVELEVCYLA